MKIRTFPKVLALIAISVILNACSKSATNTPEEMAKSIGEALIKSNKPSFEKFIINQDVAIEMFKQLIVSAKKDKLYKQRLPKLQKELTSLQSSSNVTLARVRTKVKASFDAISKQAKKDGVDLSKATFGKVVDIRTDKYLDRIKYDIYFTVNSGGSDYTIKLDDVVTISDKLYLLDEIVWKGKKTNK